MNTPPRATISRIEIKNYRCFLHVTAQLKPLTVLIGKNDTGKSAFLKAVDRLARSADTHYHEIEFWQGNRTLQPHISAKSVNGPIELGKPSSPPLRIASFRLATDGIPMMSEGYSDEKAIAPDLERNGSGVPRLLDYFLRRDRGRLDEFTKTMRSLVPGLMDIDIGTPNAAHRRVELRIDGGFMIPAEEVSAGTRLMLFFVALAYHPTPPQVVLLEEPENGVHPHRLKEIVSFLRGVTTGLHSKQGTTQIILTTHSPYLVDFIDLETDQVLVFQRNSDGSRTAVPVERERLKGFLEEFRLGEVWYNQEEPGLIAKPETSPK